jgi:hypothetical protein
MAKSQLLTIDSGVMISFPSVAPSAFQCGAVVDRPLLEQGLDRCQRPGCVAARLARAAGPLVTA